MAHGNFLWVNVLCAICLHTIYMPNPTVDVNRLQTNRVRIIYDSGRRPRIAGPRHPGLHACRIDGPDAKPQAIAPDLG
jgi:hypothetical protein